VQATIQRLGLKAEDLLDGKGNFSRPAKKEDR
jgi:hypothetical protein